MLTLCFFLLAPRRTPCAVDATGHRSTDRARLAPRVDTLPPRSAHTSGDRRLSEEKLPALDACATSRTSPVVPRTASRPVPPPRRLLLPKHAVSCSQHILSLSKKILHCSNQHRLASHIVISSKKRRLTISRVGAQVGSVSVASYTLLAVQPSTLNAHQPCSPRTITLVFSITYALRDCAAL